MDVAPFPGLFPPPHIPLDIGVIGTIDFRYQRLSPQALTLKPSHQLVDLFVNSKLHEDTLVSYQTKHDNNFEQQIALFHHKYNPAYVDPKFLREILKEETIWMQERAKYLQRHCHLLTSLQLGSESCLLFPYGESLESIRAVLSNKLVAVYTPNTQDTQKDVSFTIRQIVSAPLPSNRKVGIVVCRGDYSIRILKLYIEDEKKLRLDLLHAITFSDELSDCAICPNLDLDIAFACRNGAVYLWEGSHSPDRLRLLAEPTLRTSISEHVYYKIEFASHPKSLYLSNSDRVELLRYQTSQTRSELLFPITDKDKVDITKDKIIMLYDERYPMRPLLSWLHHVENGPRQVVVPNVKFPQNPTANCIFLDGGEKGGVIVWMYEYDMSGFVEHNDEMDALCELITQGRPEHQQNRRNTTTNGVGINFGPKSPRLSTVPQKLPTFVSSLVNLGTSLLPLCLGGLAVIVGPTKAWMPITSNGDISNQDIVVFHATLGGDVFVQNFTISFDIRHAVEVPSSFAGISTAIHQSPVAALDVRELKPTPKGALLDADVVDLRNLFRFLTKTEDEDTSQSAEEEEVPDRLELLQKSGFMEYLQTPREVPRNLREPEMQAAARKELEKLRTQWQEHFARAESQRAGPNRRSILQTPSASAYNLNVLTPATPVTPSSPTRIFRSRFSSQQI